MHTDHFVSDNDWLALAEFIAAKPSLCTALGICDDEHSSAPGVDQMLEGLGKLCVWPERFRADFEADAA
ncbi:hypothetical protein [Devosia sp. Leaf64]|uniref:hypothetical protein n=1 Tax=Devosia sp. Leaf64 TaxID=1736229 RepID=UPI00071480B8|nr:hypothetical protein [Devosia sp. Leaf64]KQN72408.1 hypothetical protein ASE94_07800 [Devosia sp. Leaf64]